MLQFEKIEGFSTEHLRAFWERISADFPRQETQPRVETPLETFNASPFGIPDFPMFAAASGSGRHWLISADDALLIQIQDNRFVHNWRYRGNEYPHFEALLESFWKRIEVFRQVIAEHGLPKLQPIQIEVNYINWITDLPMTKFFKPAAASELSDDRLGPLPQDQGWVGRYLVKSESDQPVGRVYVQCQPAVRMEPQPALGSQLGIIYRAPIGLMRSDDEISEALADGRNHIVRTFTDLTTTAAHEHWGRFQ